MVGFFIFAGPKHLDPICMVVSEVIVTGFYLLQVEAELELKVCSLIDYLSAGSGQNLCFFSSPERFTKQI